MAANINFLFHSRSNGDQEKQNIANSQKNSTSGIEIKRHMQLSEVL